MEMLRLVVNPWDKKIRCLQYGCRSHFWIRSHLSHLPPISCGKILLTRIKFIEWSLLKSADRSSKFSLNFCFD